MSTKLRGPALIALAVTMLLGCVTARPVLDTPAGFAVYEDESVWRAVSPEGVTVRVRLVENRPAQTLAFWAEALKTQLEKSGYTLTGEEKIETTVGEAVLLEWAAPVGEDDWTYLTGLAVTEEGIAVAEAAGVFEHYRKHRQAIVDSLETLAVR